MLKKDDRIIGITSAISFVSLGCGHERMYMSAKEDDPSQSQENAREIVVLPIYTICVYTLLYTRT